MRSELGVEVSLDMALSSIKGSMFCPPFHGATAIRRPMQRFSAVGPGLQLPHYVDPKQMSSSVILILSSGFLRPTSFTVLRWLLGSLSHVSGNFSQRFRRTAVRLHFSQARSQKTFNTVTSSRGTRYGYVICYPFMIRVVARNFMGV